MCAFRSYSALPNHSFPPSPCLPPILSPSLSPPLSLSLSLPLSPTQQDLYGVRSDLGNLLKALGQLDAAKVRATVYCALCDNQIHCDN